MILAIETSCDDSCIAIIDPDDGTIISNIISSQIDIHKKFGGVVPELASRSHLTRLPILIQSCLQESKIKKEQIQAVAVTQQPGLIGSLLIGVSYAKSFAWGLDIPVIGLDHLEGHLLSSFIENPQLKFPFISLIISGGHTHFFLAHKLGSYQLLGKTIDDAAGEAYDKVAKLLGFQYPGGKIIDQLAQNYQGELHELPFPLEHKKNFDFSFSGLKTAVLRIAEKQNIIDTTKSLTSYEDFLASKQSEIKQEKMKLAASFQKQVEKIIKKRFTQVLQESSVRQFTICGGVAANQGIRKQLSALATQNNYDFFYPSMPLCTDNAAMIGYTAWCYFQKNGFPTFDIALSPLSQSRIYS